MKIQTWISKIEAILASEIECGVFEQHVAPALDLARKVIVEEADMPIAWMVKGSFTELFTDLEEAHKYASTIGANVTSLYKAPGGDGGEREETA